MKKRRQHKHGVACIVTRGGKLFCRRTYDEIVPISKKARSCASNMVAEEIRDMKKRGRWKSRAQAIAVGLSRARKSCPAR